MPKRLLFSETGRASEGDRYRIEGLEPVLRDGYGSFTLNGFVEGRGNHRVAYRADYHLTAESFDYECYTSTTGAPFVKTGDWTTKREKVTP